MNSTLINDVKEILLEHGISEYDIDNESNFEVDSIQFISILVSLEQKFNIEIPDESILMPEEFNVKYFYTLVNEILENKIDNKCNGDFII